MLNDQFTHRLPSGPARGYWGTIANIDQQLHYQQRLRVVSQTYHQWQRGSFTEIRDHRNPQIVWFQTLWVGERGLDIGSLGCRSTEHQLTPLREPVRHQTSRPP